MATRKTTKMGMGVVRQRTGATVPPPASFTCPAPSTKDAEPQSSDAPARMQSGPVAKAKSERPPRGRTSRPPASGPVARPKKDADNELLPSASARRAKAVRIDEVGSAAVTLATGATTPRPTPAAGRPAAKLDPREAWVLSLVDGSLGIDDLADVTSIARADMVTILNRLVELGYVVMGTGR